ncbi:MAG: glycosyltransferase family 4 protein [Lachnospiraceae bacterium]
MKILIASDWYEPVINGVVTSIINLKSGLEELGHEVRVLTLSMSSESYREGDVYYIGSLDAQRVYPGARIKLKLTQNEVKDIIAWKPDVIHTQNEFSTFFIARKIAKRLSIPMIHTYHTMYEDYTHYFFKTKTVGRKAVVVCSKLLGKNVSCIIAPTYKINRIVKSYHVECPIHTVPTGISLKKFQAKTGIEQMHAIKEALGIPSDHLVLVSVSRLGKEKRMDELIRYMNKLKGRNISLVIVGDGPQKKYLGKLIQQLQLSSQVKLTGMIAPDQIPTYYQLGDLFVSASTSEAQGLTYIEALASATPLLCRKDDCLEGVLEEGVNGYSFETEEEFIQKLEKYMMQNDREQMSLNAENSSAKFSRETFAGSLEELYTLYGIQFVSENLPNQTGYIA